MASTWSSSRTASKSSSRGGWPSMRSAAAPKSAPSMQCAVRSRSTRRGRAAGLAVTLLVVGQVVQEALDLLRSGQAAEYGAFGGDESVRVHRQQSSVVCEAGGVYCTYADPAADSAVRRRRRNSLRPGDPQRARHRRHRVAVVCGRYRDSRGEDRGHRTAGGRPGKAHHRRARNGGGAGLHRHAGAIGNDDSGESASAVQDLSGHHHGDHGRGRVDRAAERRHREGRPRHLPALRRSAHLADLPRVLRAAAQSRGWESTWRATWARRRCGAWCWATTTARPPRRSWSA